MPTTDRTNAQWLEVLADRTHADFSAALADLTEFLRGGLSRSLADRATVTAADIDDFAQDGILRVLDKVDSFRGDSRFTTWAMAVTLRVAFSAMRKRSWGERTLTDLRLDDRPDAPVSATSPGADPSDRGELLEIFRRAIENDLTPRQRTAILAELAGMPQAVLADQLGMTRNAIYKLHHDARRKLRSILLSKGFDELDVRRAVEGASG